MSEAEVLRAIIKLAREHADELRAAVPMSAAAYAAERMARRFDTIAELAQKGLDDNPEFDWGALQQVRKATAEEEAALLRASSR